jgi:hypothetical protein
MQNGQPQSGWSAVLVDLVQVRFSRAFCVVKCDLRRCARGIAVAPPSCNFYVKI